MTVVQSVVNLCLLAGVAIGCSGQPLATANASGSAKPAPGVAAEEPASAGAGLRPMSTHAATDAEPPIGAELVQPAAGGTTVADVWANRKKLAGTSVTVRGKVVKYNGGILGANWLHLQDGTGSASDRTNDLTVTSTDEAKVGDVVTVTGVVVIDKDFGAGYAYAVLLEKAQVRKN